MLITRLRLSGFKSFVESTDLPIEPGLTGVVGPNGCGKSNLFEALRWVMGASSAKAMRGGEMDDVIFGGSADRPARNHAEVTVTLDNGDHTAPALFNIHPLLEVTRRIDRGEGSTYSVNGSEVRARDVQLLFADASSGANSPALVRQGQISELIAARPQNRRRVLEEAAGVSGLHGRRHEAELKVRAAQANLARVDDLSRELELLLARLRREARAATRYKTLSAEIRALRGAVAHARWRDARLAWERARVEEEAATVAAGTAAAAAAAAAAAVIAADEALGPLRAEEAAAAAVQHRLEIEKDRLEQSLANTLADRERLAADMVRIEADIARESGAVMEAAEAAARLERELVELEAASGEASDCLPQLQEQAARCEAERAAAAAAMEMLAKQTAAAEVERRSMESRVAEAEVRRQRGLLSVSQARAEMGALELAKAAPVTAPESHETAATALALARNALEKAESTRAAASLSESESREAFRAQLDRLSGLEAEKRALDNLTRSSSAAFDSALDQTSPLPGYEAALAAALGEDGDGALDPGAPVFWGGARVDAPEWPSRATPLSGFVSYPSALAARLAYTALVERKDGPSLQGNLPPGARIVSVQGDLWRWDGFTSMARARRPAQIRMEQRARIEVLDLELSDVRPRARTLEERHGAAVRAMAQAEEATRRARASVVAAAEDFDRTRAEGEAREREDARLTAKLESIVDLIALFETDARVAAVEVALALEARAAADRLELGLGDVAAARDAAERAREAAARARGALDHAMAEREARARRLETVVRERGGWLRRAEASVARQEELQSDRGRTQAALAEAEGAPAATRRRQLELVEATKIAEARKSRSGDALAAGDNRRQEAERAARAAELTASEARELRAGSAARLEAAQARLEEQATALSESTGLSPEDLAERLAETDGKPSPDAEAHLAALERERESIGPVNLMAEAEAAELGARVQAMGVERADLAGALRRLDAAIVELNSEGRDKLLAAFERVDRHFRALFTSLFEGGHAELRLVESTDPLEAGLEILACPPGKRMVAMSLMSGGEQALTAIALIFAVFLANPAPICFLDEVDAPLDDANIERFCNLLDQMRRQAPTRFVTITHNPLTMSRMDRLFGVTMAQRGISQLLSVDLRAAEVLAAQ